MTDNLSDPKYLASLPTGGPREFWTSAKQFVDRNNVDWFMVKAGSEQHQAWVCYLQHKGWKLWFVEKLNRETIKEAVFPAEWPEIFDPSYAPPHVLPPIAPYYPKEKPYPNISRRQIPEPQQGSRANVLVRAEAPDYARMVELAPSLDIQDWRWDHRGIWIALNIYSKAKGEPRPLKTPEARAEHLAQTFPEPELRESDKALAASPALVKTLTDQRRVRADIAPRPHWSDLGS